MWPLYSKTSSFPKYLCGQIYKSSLGSQKCGHLDPYMMTPHLIRTLWLLVALQLTLLGPLECGHLLQKNSHYVVQVYTLHTPSLIRTL